MQIALSGVSYAYPSAAEPILNNVSAARTARAASCRRRWTPALPPRASAS